MAKRNKPVLPGQSRSTACAFKDAEVGNRPCARLQGHHGKHRFSLTLRGEATVAAKPKPRASAKARPGRTTTRRAKPSVRWTRDAVVAFKAAVATAVLEDAITPSEGLALIAEAITGNAEFRAKAQARKFLAASTARMAATA